MARHDMVGDFHDVLELNHCFKGHRPCFIGSLTSAGHGLFWITVENDKGRVIKSRQYNCNGQVLENLKLSLPTLTGYHIITPGGSIYFYKGSSETIELVQGDKTRTIASLKDLQLNPQRMVLGMYCSASSIIFLAICSKLWIGRNVLEHGGILRYDSACDHVSMIQCDSSGDYLFKSPRCTVENQNKIMCTVDVGGIILYDQYTNKRIQCAEIPSPQYVATLTNQFVIHYKTNHQQTIGVLSEAGHLLSSLQIPCCEIRAMCSDDEGDLLVLIKDGSVIKRMPLKL